MNSAIVFALLATVAAASAGVLAPAPLAVPAVGYAAPVAAYAHPAVGLASPYAVSPFGLPVAKAVAPVAPIAYAGLPVAKAVAPFGVAAPVAYAAPAIIG